MPKNEFDFDEDEDRPRTRNETSKSNGLATAGIGRSGAATALVVRCDGSVRRVNKNIDPMVFRRLAGRADGMVVEIPPLAD